MSQKCLEGEQHSIMSADLYGDLDTMGTLWSADMSNFDIGVIEDEDNPVLDCAQWRYTHKEWSD